jgi:hypothetical protein
MTHTLTTCSTTTRAACSGRALWLWQESLHGQQLGGVDEKLVPSLVAGGQHTLRHLDCKILWIGVDKHISTHARGGGGT